MRFWHRTLLHPLILAVAAAAFVACAEITGPSRAGCEPQRDFASAECVEPLMPLIPLPSAR